MRINFPRDLSRSRKLRHRCDRYRARRRHRRACDGWRARRAGARNAELAAADQALRLAAYGDALTGVANRAAFLERLADPPTRGCVAMIDLDELKRLNDRFGHAAGDAALVSVARALLQRIGERGTIYRIGGDEFAVIWTGIGADDARALLSAADADLTVLSEDLRLPQRILVGCRSLRFRHAPQTKR